MGRDSPAPLAVSRSAASPRRTLIAGMGFAGGAGLGFGIILLMELLNKMRLLLVLVSCRIWGLVLQSLKLL